jgi:hypothetical protein
MENNFQRIGSISNTHVGWEFEEAARLFFAETGVHFAVEFRRNGWTFDQEAASLRSGKR